MNKPVSTLHKFQTLAILLLIFADGCDVGQFSLSSFDVWSVGGIINVLLHALPGFLFIGFGITFFYSPQRLAPRIWISVLSAIAVVGNIVLIIMGVTNSDPNSVGVHSPVSASSLCHRSMYGVLEASSMSCFMPGRLSLHRLWHYVLLFAAASSPTNLDQCPLRDCGCRKHCDDYYGRDKS